MMSDVKELRDKAAEFKRAKDFVHAAAIYNSLWADTEPKDKSDGWGFAYCLQKLERYKEAIDVAREVLKVDPAFTLARNVLGWSLYMAEIKPRTDPHQDEDQEENGPNPKQDNAAAVRAAAEEIVNLTKQEQFSPYTATVLAVSKLLIGTGSIDGAENALTWLAKLDESKLERRNPFMAQLEQKSGKREYPKDFESYQLRKAKALLNAEQYANCVELCGEWLKSFPSRQGPYDYWLGYYRAKAHAASGHLEQSIEELTKLAALKPEWFIFAQMADLYLEKEDFVAAWKAALTGATSSTRNPNSMVNLFLAMCKILDGLGRTEDAKQH
jgi:tetratricopeptide (TPR) repeat protein